MNVVTVRRQNKVLNVPEERLEYYLSEGYDAIDKNGNVVKHATGGKEVPLGEYNKLVKELEAAKEYIKALEEKVASLGGLQEGTEEAEKEAKKATRKKK